VGENCENVTNKKIKYAPFVCFIEQMMDGVDRITRMYCHSGGKKTGRKKMYRANLKLDIAATRSTKQIDKSEFRSLSKKNSDRLANSNSGIFFFFFAKKSRSTAGHWQHRVEQSALSVESP
jgi:hypothetical protein